MDDALANIQRQRRIIQGLWQFKRLNASGAGNKPNTRMVTLYKRFDNKIQQAAQEYRAGWRALRVLDPNGSWSLRLQELKDKDISGPGQDPDDTSSKSRYVPSWIWLVQRVSESSEEEFNESMRVEWAKVRACKMRWKEELLLVQEEMRRVIEYMKWREGWWRDRCSLRTHIDGTISSGLSGYANKQAAICRRIAERCACYWLPLLERKGITPLWASGFRHTVTPNQESGNAKNNNEVDVEDEDDNDIIDHDEDVDDDIEDIDDDDFLEYLY